ncbi:MAG: endonuclease/exonuclease/phosphatase family protein [Candidatus Acidiferrales bacterium]
MKITVGTFNLNNLFSRYNFKGEIDAIESENTTLNSTVTYSFTDAESYRIRTFRGRLVKGKTRAERETIAARILAMNVDVLAVQEVEDIDTLDLFAREHLEGLYPYRALVEGNDIRLIDLGLLSRFPLGAVTSWRHRVHPANPGRPVFSRDLLQAEILNPARTRTLFTLFNNHLKSHFVPFGEDPVAGAAAANQSRQRQAESIAAVVSERLRPDSRYLIAGDMNDPPDSQWLEPLVGSDLAMVDALEHPLETRPAKADTPPPPGPAWTHRFKESGQPARYELFDQIWLSPALADKQTGAWIDRRTKHSGDASDHDPAWIELNL